MKEGLFRKKSMQKISSPEQLNEYISVSNPGVWMILVSIILILAGICVWGIWGSLETTLEICAISRDGKTICYVKEENAADISEGMTVQIEDAEYRLENITASPMQITGDFDAYALYIGNLQAGEWVYAADMKTGLEDGIYEARIVTESIAPMTFLLN